MFVDNIFYPQIHVFLMLCILVAITSILMYWIIMPLIVKGEKPIEWNLYFGAFLGIVALIFVVSMKGSFVAFKASFFQYNCLSKAPQTQVNLLEFYSKSCVFMIFFMDDNVNLSPRKAQ